jgi:steroid delta-isomerase-like uncharacterized protein
MKSMSQRAVIDRIVDTIQRAAAEEYAQLFAKDAVLEHPLTPEPLRGRAIIQEGEQALFDAFSDIDIEVRSTTSEERRIVAEVVLRATNTGSLDLGDGEPIPATGRRIEVPAIWIFEFDPAGLVEAERDYFDTNAMLVQLGLNQ